MRRRAVPYSAAQHCGEPSAWNVNQHQHHCQNFWQRTRQNSYFTTKLWVGLSVGKSTAMKLSKLIKCAEIFMLCLFAENSNFVISCAIVACNYCIRHSALIAGFTTCWKACNYCSALHATTAHETTSWRYFSCQCNLHRHIWASDETLRPHKVTPTTPWGQLPHPSA